MSELDFALDGLYAAGWWPSQGDICLQTTDHRWYLSPDAIRVLFEKHNAELNERSDIAGKHLTLSWYIPGHGWESVTARSQSAAYLFAYTHLYQVTNREEPATIRQ